MPHLPTKPTDPRLLLCAQALYDAMDIADGLTPQAAEAYALACILKWLEQAPTEPMITAGMNVGTVPVCHGEVVVRWDAMMAQAAKELTD